MKGGGILTGVKSEMRIESGSGGLSRILIILVTRVLPHLRPRLRHVMHARPLWCIPSYRYVDNPEVGAIPSIAFWSAATIERNQSNIVNDKEIQVGI